MFNVHCLIDMFADLYYNRNFRDFSEIFENRPKNLISQFFGKNISRRLCTSGFKCGNLTIDFTANSTPFKNSKKGQ